MALTSSYPIDLLDIQAETSTSSLAAAGGVAGFTSGGTHMSEFLGWSAAIQMFPPSSGWSVVNLTSNSYISSNHLFLNSRTVFNSYFQAYFRQNGGAEKGGFPSGSVSGVVVRVFISSISSGIVLSARRRGGGSVAFSSGTGWKEVTLPTGGFDELQLLITSNVDGSVTVTEVEYSEP